MGAAAYATSLAVAETWRPFWHVILYCLLLSLAARFLIFALFEGVLLSASGLFTDFVWLTVVGLVGYRVTHVRKMVAQYPWLYVHAGPWRYRARKPH